MAEETEDPVVNAALVRNAAREAPGDRYPSTECAKDSGQAQLG